MRKSSRHPSQVSAALLRASLCCCLLDGSKLPISLTSPCHTQHPLSMQVGAFVDAGAPSSEVLAVLDLQRARLAQLVAQAEELARLQHELAVEAAGPGAGPGAPPSAGAVGGIPWEVQDAEATLQRCFELWALVAEAEALRDGGPAEQLGEQAEGGADGPLAALRARLAGLRGNGGAPPCAVWLRANTAVLACVGGLPA